jgi:hypothetical protein
MTFVCPNSAYADPAAAFTAPVFISVETFVSKLTHTLGNPKKLHNTNPNLASFLSSEDAKQVRKVKQKAVVCRN